MENTFGLSRTGHYNEVALLMRWLLIMSIHYKVNRIEANAVVINNANPQPTLDKH